MATRIIGGEFGSRVLKSPKGSDTRPTRAMVREALFDILQRHVRESRVLDLFAGSGALGLEALSRGAKKAVFADKSRAAVDAVNTNIEALKVRERCLVLNMDCFAAIRWLKSQDWQFDMVFLDPPYSMDPLPVLETLRDQRLLAPEAIIAAEHTSSRPLALPDGFSLIRSRVYGDTALSIATEGVQYIEGDFSRQL